MLGGATFDPLSSILAAQPAWTKLPRLPIEFWRFKSIEKLLAEANVGRLVRLDFVSQTKAKLALVRALVEVNLNTPLIQQLDIEVKGQKREQY